MNGPLEVVALASLWMFLTGELTVVNLVVGAGLAFVVRVFGERVAGFSPTLRQYWRAFALVVFFFRELIASNVKVAMIVASPRYHIRPGIVGVPLDARSDAEITLLANLITLTPGTMSVDVSEDRRTLYVHGMDVADRDAFIRSIKDGFERRVLEVLR